jgi:hypothetical protein
MKTTEVTTGRYREYPELPYQAVPFTLKSQCTAILPESTKTGATAM